MTYAHFELRYEDNPQPSDAWKRKAWFSYVGDKKISLIDADDDGWFALFTAIGIPEAAHIRLREYKKLLGRM